MLQWAITHDINTITSLHSARQHARDNGRMAMMTWRARERDKSDGGKI